MADRRFSFHPYKRSRILEILDDWHLIDFDPQYQRKGGAWSLPKKQFFIDSIINGMDLTKLYFHQLPVDTLARQSIKYGVIDGKQRLEAVKGFVRDDFPLSDDFEYLHSDNHQAAGKTYSELLTEFPILRARFDRTVLPVTVMEAEDELLIENLFVRLNEQVNLTAAEKRNALGGPIPIRIRALASHLLFTRCVPFPDGRYRHRDLAAKFLWIVHERKFVTTKRKDLDDFVHVYRLRPNSQPSPDNLLQDAQEVSDAMCDFFIAKDPLLQSVGWITLYFHLFRLRLDNYPRARITRNHFRRFVSEVTRTRRLVRQMADGNLTARQSAINPDLAQFDSLRQSLNDATALRTRYAILRRYFASEVGITLPADSDGS